MRKPNASDMKCFVLLMEKFKVIYGHYPKYLVEDAGYGYYNNYIYFEEYGMEKYMKFVMLKKKLKMKNTIIISTVLVMSREMRRGSSFVPTQ